MSKTLITFNIFFVRIDLCIQTYIPARIAQLVARPLREREIKGKSWVGTTLRVVASSLGVQNGEEMSAPVLWFGWCGILPLVSRFGDITPDIKSGGNKDFITYTQMTPSPRY